MALLCLLFIALYSYNAQAINPSITSFEREPKDSGLDKAQVEKLKELFPMAADRVPELSPYLEPPSYSKTTDVSNLNFSNLPLLEAARMMSEWTGKRFVVSPDLNLSISIELPETVTQYEVYIAFLASLSGHGLTTVPKDKDIHIVRSQKTKPLGTTGNPVHAKVIRLEKVDATKIQPRARIIANDEGRVIAFEPKNSLIVMDRQANLEVLTLFLKELDVEKLEADIHFLKIDTDKQAEKAEESMIKIFGSSSKYGNHTKIFARGEKPLNAIQGEVKKVAISEKASRMMVVADKAGFESLQTQMGPIEEASYWPSAAYSISSPSAFGADWLTLNLGAVILDRRDKFLNDGALSASVGLGNSRKYIGVEVGMSIGGVLNQAQSGLQLEEIGIHLKLHRYLGWGFAVAVGTEDLIYSGAPALRQNTYYGVVSKYFSLRDSEWDLFSSMVLSVGVGNKRLKNINAFRKKEDGAGVFASFGIRVWAPFNAIADWKGNDLDLGISATPYHNDWLTVLITSGFLNVLRQRGPSTMDIVPETQFFIAGALSFIIF